MDNSSNDQKWEPTSGRHRLLGGWRDILDDVRTLERGLRHTPDACECGDGPAHLGGTCACCAAAERQSGLECVDCHVLVHTVSWKLDQLSEDTLRYFPAVTSLVQPSLSRDDAEQLDRVRHEIAVLMATMRRMETASAEFSHGCRTTHLHRLKEVARELLMSARRLDDVIDPTPPESGARSDR